MILPGSAKAKRQIVFLAPLLKMFRRPGAAGSLCVLITPFSSTVVAQDDHALVSPPIVRAVREPDPSPARPPSLIGASQNPVNPVLPQTRDDSLTGRAAGTGFLQSPLQWGPFQLRPHL